MKRAAVVFSALAALACSEPPSTMAGPGSVDGDGASGDGSESCSESASAPLLRRLSRREFVRTLDAVFPSLRGAYEVSLSADPLSLDGYDNDPQLLLVGNQKAEELFATASSLAAALDEARLAELLPCAATATDRGCAGELVRTYGRRLFRRSLTDDEVERYLTLFDQVREDGSFLEGARWLLQALVQSPHTVWRREIGALADGRYVLSQTEIASELAYAYSGRPPSDALLDAAEAGELDGPEALEATARELLADSAREVFGALFDIWFAYARARTIEKPGVPAYAEQRGELVEETRRFLELVVVDQGGGIAELLTSRETSLTAELVSYYGYAVEAGDEPSVVTRPEGRGVGLFAQASWLSGHAKPDGSSPTQRGIFVTDRLLCRPRLAPLPDIPELAPPSPGVVTTRERYERQHAQPGTVCAGCHVQFDPIGFAFEHYDEAGRYRADEGGLTIDATGTLASAGQALSFDGMEELAQELSDLDETYRCASSKLTRFAFGVLPGESCADDAAYQEFADGARGFVDYYASLARLAHLRERRAP